VVCARALATPAPTMHMGLANSLAMICAAGPDAVDDWARPLALIEQALASLARVTAGRDERDQLEHEFRGRYGAVLCRAGRSQAAIEQLEKAIALQKGQDPFHDWLFLALAYHRLGHAEQSSTYLARARAAKPKTADGGLWEKVEIDLLLDEARTLLEGGGSIHKTANQ
jgi:tetratricopeptide (TPR) repeat protein